MEFSMQRSFPAQHPESPFTGSPQRVVSLGEVYTRAPMLHAMVDITMDIDCDFLDVLLKCQTTRKDFSARRRALCSLN